ncbi:putative helicase MAGATAMA 3 [Apostasia shenzhenica]|uniref:Putative helicase MAGATAMA 3 n=1 Tax=Apostasia shenzhenica TaxID=1088818 RepID=A0A2I0A5D1_9ASPA|nr:putative helicase MAGATAMA 3 [Apostasia shenzhenica]
MGSRGRILFDLNEPPAEEIEDEPMAVVPSCVPQKSLPTFKLNPSSLLPALEECPRIVNNHAFTHAAAGSRFQPFVRTKEQLNSKEPAKLIDASSVAPQTSAAVVVRCEDDKADLDAGIKEVQSAEKEEGEWSDMESNADATGSSGSKEQVKADVDGPDATMLDVNTDLITPGVSNGDSAKDAKVSDENSKGEAPADVLEEPPGEVKRKEIRGMEASHALRLATINPAKRAKYDEEKEQKLGKLGKKKPKTILVGMDDVKNNTSMKNSSLRRQPSFATTIVTRTVKDIARSSPVADRTADRMSQGVAKDQKQQPETRSEGNSPIESGEHRADPNGDANSGPQTRSRKISSNDCPQEMHPPPNLRQGSWKQPVDSRQLKNTQVSCRRQTVMCQDAVDVKPGNKRPLPSKKQNFNNIQFNDTSVERLLREVTNEKFWHHPEESDLECVPGRFESVEEYLRVFEPLLFEECRAQLYSTWEELAEIATRDAHVMVHVKMVERRERGWYDAIVIPVHECKWTFKEGDVAVLSTPRPGLATRSNKKNTNGGANEHDGEYEASGRVAGTVRRHIPTDTRDPPGAILHFYLGDSHESCSKVDDDNILRKFKPKSIWYLTVLGSLATTQREYVALHAFRRLNLQMQTAILKPSPEHFPKYEEQIPALPECFTQNFVDHIRRTFNSPQLAAIQWAAMHTAAGTSNGSTKRQEPWPFTLVQGPPGTGKTHTVWGMLNVIHLVQYQHYYTALLKKLAPESYKQSSETTADCIGTGSIDEVLQSMDQNLFRTLPKLCPKPRMLVCAPSNAATDELLSRVLDRGFIDGEMKVYRPDVARVGVDSQTRAAQAVSVERRTEQLLMKGREEIHGWIHQLRAREAQFSQQISLLQRELCAAAAVGRSQGSVGVDPDVLADRDHNRDLLLQSLAAAVEGRDKVLVELSRLCILESRFRPGSTFNLEDARASLEASFANEAEIVFTTVSSSGRKLFSRLTHGFDMVVIDEAAQASEVAVLPPLSLGAARCVLVGDPQQLPATVISKAAGTLLYSRSLFERFQQAGCPTMLLSVQYRMHPQIREFPSRYFYQARLTDSESVASLPDEIYYKDPLMQPYIFYDIMHGRESHRGSSVSYQNIMEAQFALRLYEHLQKFLKANGARKVTVGIITPYKLQLKCLQREFEEVLNSEEGKDIYINTVDAFQGQERDVIIMSCVRASNHGVGFVADIRRMNVALTRARRALWVVGNANALMQSDDWAALINDAKARKCFMDIDSLPKDFMGVKGSSYTAGKSSNNTRSFRSSGPRQRHIDMMPEVRSGTPSEDEEKLGSLSSRNGSHRSSTKSGENSFDETGHSGDKSRDYGIPKRQNSLGRMLVAAVNDDLCNPANPWGFDMFVTGAGRAVHRRFVLN